MPVVQASSRFKVAAIAAAVVLLTACGGGDGGSGDSGSPQTSPPASGSNTAPTIKGTPAASVLAGNSYSFQPIASDPNGDTLKFSAANLPSWATLNATTGRLSGTPTAADIGTFSNISISVSDGKESATLAAFSIAVTAAGTGTAIVSWTPPTENTDGSVLTNLTGYRILYGRSANELDQSISITNPSLSTFVVENLTSGAWYFAVVAVNSNGNASDPSNVASKTIG